MQIFVRLSGIYALAFLLCASVQEGIGAEAIVPASRLRSADPSRFNPYLVKLGKPDLQEAIDILNRQNREDLAAQIEKSWRMTSMDEVAVLAPFLTARSPHLQEWALRTLGETPGDKKGITPRLLAIASQTDLRDEIRALAIRVLGAEPLEKQSVTVLLSLLPQCKPQLQLILLEVLGRGGPEVQAALPELRKYLAAPDAGVQYYAYQAIRQLEAANNAIPGSPVANAASGASWREIVRVVQDDRSPKYQVAQALRELATQPPEKTVVAAVLAKVAGPDPFISELATNVLGAYQQLAPETLTVLVEGLGHSNNRVRLQAALMLKQHGAGGAPLVPALNTALARAGREGASLSEVGACLDLLRGFGTNAASAAPTIVNLLDERSPIYQGLLKHEVHHLRGYLLVVLAGVGVPDAAWPYIMSGLANSDGERVLEYAGAARAAAALGPRAREAMPFLLRPFQEGLPERFITFESFDAHLSSNGEYTTCQIEAIRALKQIGPPAREAVPILRSVAEHPGLTLDNPRLFKRIPNVRAEALTALAAIEPVGGVKN